MKIEVREVSATDTAWDGLVRSSRQNCLFVAREFLETWAGEDPSWHLLKLGCYDETNRLICGQAIIHRKMMGVRVQNTLSTFYAGTPILAGEVPENSLAQYEILSALARESRKRFPYLRIEFHPHLTDARAYLDNGWEAAPQYTHTWDLRDLNAVLKSMHRKQTYVRKAQDMFDFSIEHGEEIVNEFLRLYAETMAKFGWQPPASWKEAFRRKARWLESQDVLRPFTCRTKAGEIVGVALYILSRESRTAYFWLVGYDHERNSKEFPPAIHYYAAQNLAAEFDMIDFGEGGNSSLFAFKDSLGTDSLPFWVLKSGDISGWVNVYLFLRKARQALLKFIP
jgi:hypothetical protein